jgi:hypothetical protein
MALVAQNTPDSAIMSHLVAVSDIMPCEFRNDFFYYYIISCSLLEICNYTNLFGTSIAKIIIKL